MIELALAFGSNLGDRLGAIAGAYREVAGAIGEIVRYSGVYRTAAIAIGEAGEESAEGGDGEFLNTVAIARTTLSPREVLREIHRIEALAGRPLPPRPRVTSRTLDIDILLYGALTVTEDELTIPHPELLNRDFMLVPLKEVGEGLIHPVMNVPIRTLPPAPVKTILEYQTWNERWDR